MKTPVPALMETVHPAAREVLDLLMYASSKEDLLRLVIASTNAMRSAVDDNFTVGLLSTVMSASVNKLVNK